MGPECFGGAKFSRFFPLSHLHFRCVWVFQKNCLVLTLRKLHQKFHEKTPRKRENKRVKFVTGEGKIAEFGAANLAQAISLEQHIAFACVEVWFFKGWQSMDVPSGWIQVLRRPRPKSVQWPLAKDRLQTGPQEGVSGRWRQPKSAKKERHQLAPNP